MRSLNTSCTRVATRSFGCALRPCCCRSCTPFFIDVSPAIARRGGRACYKLIQSILSHVYGQDSAQAALEQGRPGLGRRGQMDFPQQNSRGWGAARSMLAATLVAILVAACGGGSGGGPGMPTISAGGGPSGGTVKVALLLPLTSSGNTPAVAKALKQAAELALFDFDNPGVALVPKDTHGTPDGARAAAQSAVSEGAELIIGPLFAQEVTRAAPVARQANVPMIAFSSDESVAGNGIYLLSFLAGRDVPRIVSFALSRGKKNFAVLVPQSPYGRIAEAAFAKAVTQGGGQAAVRATYASNDANAMIGPVRQIANAIKSGQQIDAVFLPAG